MPSQLHESLIEMFSARPALVAELLSGPLGVRVPPFERAALSAAELTVVRPVEFRADAVVTLLAKWGCDVLLLVVCPKPKVAAWSAVPIRIGDPGLVLTPVVLGPGAVPVVTDPVQARGNPQLAVLSALAHAPAGRVDVLEALLAGLSVVDQERADMCAEVVFEALPDAIRNKLEEMMSTTSERFQGPLAQRLMARGEARGEAAAILAVLKVRGIEVPDDIRSQIMDCTDRERLDTWVRRAVTVTSAADLFE